MLKTHSQILDVIIRFPAGHYQGDRLLHNLNKAISNHEQRKSYYETTLYSLSNGSAARYRKCPEFRDLQERPIFWYNQDGVRYVEMNRELAFMLGFSVHAKHSPKRVPILKNEDFGPTQVLFSNTRPPNGGIFYYFVYLELSNFKQLVKLLLTPLLHKVPVMNQDEIVHEIEFDALYYFPVQTIS